MANSVLGFVSICKRIVYVILYAICLRKVATRSGATRYNPWNIQYKKKESLYHYRLSLMDCLTYVQFTSLIPEALGGSETFFFVECSFVAKDSGVVTWNVTR